jgi:hypothetical protein
MSQNRRSPVLAKKDAIGDKSLSLSAYRARQGQGAGGVVFTDPSANATTIEEESKRRGPSSAGLSGVWFFLCHLRPIEPRTAGKRGGKLGVGNVNWFTSRAIQSNPLCDFRYIRQLPRTPDTQLMVTGCPNGCPTTGPDAEPTRSRQLRIATSWMPRGWCSYGQSRSTACIPRG